MITFKAYLSEIKMPRERLGFKRDVRDSRDNIRRSPSRGLEYTPLNHYMKNYGFRSVGSGYYSLVYEHPSKDYIVKIFANDPNTVKWLDWVYRNQNNKYVPKLRGKMVRVADQVYAVRMEKLSHVPHLAAQGFISKVYMGSDSDMDLQRVSKFLNKFIRFVDLHEENVMERGHGQMVVTDPFASFDAITANKLTVDTRITL